MNQKAMKQMMYDRATWAYSQLPFTFEIVKLERKFLELLGTLLRL